jgi:hypothetical protein
MTSEEHHDIAVAILEDPDQPAVARWLASAFPNVARADMEAVIAECVPSIRSMDPAFARETLADLRAELGRVHPQWRTA